MATIELTLSSKKDKNTNRQEILLRFYHGKAIDCRVKTGLFILDDPGYWNGENMVDTRRMNDEDRRYHNGIREKLELLCMHLQTQWQSRDQNGTVSKKWLITETDKFFHPEKYVPVEEKKKEPMKLRDAIDAFIDGAPTRIQESGPH